VVEKFTTPDPIELPPRGHRIDRVDLIFYGIDHSGSSYEANVFMDPRGVGRDADASHRAYVGTFYIFGHGGCFGDVGHCDIPQEEDPFDLRPPHQLEPALRILTVTDAVTRLLERGVEAAKVTVVARSEGRAPNDVLDFDTVRLATYA
jgi:tyrosinase